MFVLLQFWHARFVEVLFGFGTDEFHRKQQLPPSTFSSAVRLLCITVGWLVKVLTSFRRFLSEAPWDLSYFCMVCPSSQEICRTTKEVSYFRRTILRWFKTCTWTGMWACHKTVWQIFRRAWVGGEGFGNKFDQKTFGKSALMIFRTGHERLLDKRIVLRGAVVSEVDRFTFLGVTINVKLSFTERLCAKVLYSENQCNSFFAVQKHCGQQSRARYSVSFPVPFAKCDLTVIECVHRRCTSIRLSIRRRRWTIRSYLLDYHGCLCRSWRMLNYCVLFLVCFLIMTFVFLVLLCRSSSLDDFSCSVSAGPVQKCHYYSNLAPHRAVTFLTTLCLLSDAYMQFVERTLSTPRLRELCICYVRRVSPIAVWLSVCGAFRSCFAVPLL